MKKWLAFTLFYFITFYSYANPLPADEVFQVRAKKSDAKTFYISWQIKPGYFLYKDRFKLENKKPNLTTLHQPIAFPKNQIKKDKQLNIHPIYRDHLLLPIIVSNKQAGEAIIHLHFQGCSDEGFCYPPEHRKLKLIIDKNLELTKVEINNNDLNNDLTSPEENESALTVNPQLEHSVSFDDNNPNTEFTKSSGNLNNATNNAPNLDNSPINSASPTSTTSLSKMFSSGSNTAQVLADSHWLIAIAIFMGLGLLLSFTPCVLPMVPVLSSIIIGQGKNLSTRRAFLLSLSYVLSMAFTYAIVGAVLASLGSNLQIAMQSSWAIAGFSIIFVLLALSLFGYYDLEIPSSWRTKLTAASPKGGHYLGAIVMGSLSTLILSPCVTAPLIGVLGYVAQHGNILFGCLALFSLGIGMGIPLILIGVSAGKWLPKAGPWMDIVKSFFGMVLLAVAIYLLSRILPFMVVAILWASLFIFAGIYWSPFKNLPRSFKNIIQHGVSLVLVSLGLITLSNAFITFPDIMNLNSSLSSPSTSVNPKLAMQKIETQEELHQAVRKAKGKPVLVDFYADWCISCKAMEASTLRDPRVAQKLREFVVLKVDLTSNAQAKALLKQLNVIAPPTFLFFNKSGTELHNLRLVGEVGADQFLAQLNEAAP